MDGSTGDQKDKQEKQEPVPQPAPDAEPEQSSATIHRSRWWSSREFLVVLSLTIFLVGLSKFIEHDNVAQWTQIATFAYLERLLPSTAENRLPVIVLDIKPLPMTGTSQTPVTSRAHLKEIIQALSDAGAAAIGVDIDFSGGDTGYRDPVTDPEFFKFCRLINKKTPVVIGVYRTRHGTPEKWLAVKDNAPLAASIEAASNRTLSEAQFSGEAHPPASEMHAREPKHTLARVPEDFAAAEGYRLPAIGFALAERYFKNPKNVRPQLPIDERLLSKVKHEAPLGNFSKLNQLRRERSLAWTAKAIEATQADFKDNIVILGDLEDVDRVEYDYFLPPNGIPQAGVLYHASAAYTFAKEPLYEFVGWFRMALDVLGTVPFFIAIWVKHKWAPDEQADRDRRGNIDGSALFVALLLLPALGAFLLLRYHIMWLEALLAGVFLVLHLFLTPRAERLLKGAHRLWQRHFSRTGVET